MQDCRQPRLRLPPERSGTGNTQTAPVLAALREICLSIVYDDEDLALATGLAAEHGLTVYDAAYAAVAQRRGASLESAWPTRRSASALRQSKVPRSAIQTLENVSGVWAAITS
jgi:hypothetical protein